MADALQQEEASEGRGDSWLVSRIFNPTTQLAIAWIALAGSLIGWPLSALTWAREEPQFILGLSWLALTLTAFNWISAAEANRRMQLESGRQKVTTAEAEVEVESQRLTIDEQRPRSPSP